MALVALSVLIPLAYTEVLPRTGWLESVITLGPPDPSPTPVAQPVPRPEKFVPLQVVANQLIAPTGIPSRTATIVDRPGFRNTWLPSARASPTTAF